MTKQEFLTMSLSYGLKMCYEYKDRIDIHILLPMHFDCKFQLVNERGKPILHPLSDLTKEIEHNGEKFVPIEKLNELFGYEEIRLVHYINSGLGWNITSSPVNTAISFLDMYNPIQKLIEWKFDVAGLIQKGEAIDVNTLRENPYK